MFAPTRMGLKPDILRYHIVLSGYSMPEMGSDPVKRASPKYAALASLLILRIKDRVS